MLKSLSFNKCFLGADGYNPNFGFTAADFSSARLNEIALQNAEQRIILMDSGKFNATAVVSYSRNGHVNKLITDEQPGGEILSRLKGQNTEIIVCG